MQVHATTAIPTVVADDEAPALDELVFLLREFPEIEIVGTAHNGLEAVDVSFTIVTGREKAAITLIAAKPGGSFFTLLAYGSKKGFADNAQILKSIADSIKAAN